MIKLSIDVSSDVGKTRTNNEDMIMVDNTMIRDNAYISAIEKEDTDRFIVAIADGMGGYNGGEIASEIVLQSLNKFFFSLPENLAVDQFYEQMFGWLDIANQCIEQKGKEDNLLEDMGTTLVACIYYNHNYYWANCGDSRLYRIHNGEITQITTDHSLNTLVGSTAHSHVITNCIGAGCSTSYLDFSVANDCIEQGDYLLLCSDGLTDMISDANILDIVMNGGKTADLVQAANIAGGIDNISVCLMKID